MVCSRNSKRMIKIVRRCIMVMIVMIMFVMAIMSVKMMAVVRMMMP